jgi:hypothetical protein
VEIQPLPLREGKMKTKWQGCPKKPVRAAKKLAIKRYRRANAESEESLSQLMA